MARKRKQVKTEAAVLGKKIPVNTEDPDDYLKRTPIWSFKSLDSNHEKWHFGSCDDVVGDIINKLICYEGQSWHEIQIKDNKRNHFIEIRKLCKKAIERAEELHLDVDELFSLHLTGRERLFGIVEGRCFRIIWYDPDHEICPSKLKHT